MENVKSVKSTGAAGVASMGPRLLGRGKPNYHDTILTLDGIASMGPRLLGRGKLNKNLSIKREPSASMGPRLLGRGKP